MNLSKIALYSFPLIIIFLFFYSFTQVDLSLTLSQVSIWQTVQKSFQEIGYFNRPLSTALFVLVLAALFAYYIYFLILAYRKKLKIKDIGIIICFTAVILAFSYNAFSYDLFNYIFDGKIITYYHQNPYFHKALDYPNDPMLSFMHWTHRLYPYGPFWLVLTTPLSLIGMNIFLLTFFLFKFLAAGFYLGSVYLIYKINKKINSGWEIFNTILFALNPLVIIESLVSAHNDIAMVFFALLGVYLYVEKNKLLGIFSIFLSAMIKIPTAVLLLPLLINALPFKKYHLNNEKLTWSFVILSIVGVLYSMTKLEIQPWYFLWVIPFIALLKPNRIVLAASIGFSLGLVLRYVPYLYYGSWDGFALPLRNALTLLCLFVPSIITFVWSRKKGYNLS